MKTTQAQGKSKFKRSKIPLSLYYEIYFDSNIKKTNDVVNLCMGVAIKFPVRNMSGEDWYIDKYYELSHQSS